MKQHPYPLILLAGLLTLGEVKAQQFDFVPGAADAAPATEMVRYTLLKPDDKTSEAIKPTDRNPFGKSDDALKNQNAKGTNEENTIRDRLSLLRVVGVSPGKKGLRVMLGDMVLEAGEIIPPVLVDQSVDLRVNKISPEAIELVWVEKKPTGLPPRMLTLAVDLRPYVRYKLHGLPSDKNQWQKEGTGDDEGESTVGRQFPEVSQSKISPENVVVAGASSPPESSDHAGMSPSAATPAPAVPAEPVKKNNAWDKAVGLLNQLVKMEDKKP